MKEIDGTKHTVVLNVQCNECHQIHCVPVKLEDFDRYIHKGDLVQDVWPTYDTWDREVIIGCRTGVFQCKRCHDKAELQSQDVSLDDVMNQITGDY